MSDRKDLAAEIHAFVEKHAGIAAGYDPEFDPAEERFSGPDAALLEAAAIALDESREMDFKVRSNWESGCYRPYGDMAGRAWHDDLVSRLGALVLARAPKI